jgi:hypothetical protein
MKTKTKKQTSDVTEEWLLERGARKQKLGGAFSFFGPKPEEPKYSWDDQPLLWIDVSLEGNVSLALVPREGRSMRYWMWKKTRAEIDALLTALGTVKWEDIKHQYPDSEDD